MRSAEASPTAAPAEIRELPQWVVWRYEHRQAGKKATKVPYSPIGGARASTQAPSTWASFSEAITAWQRDGFDGVGFVFSGSDPYCGIDLDDCLSEDGSLSDEARQIVDQLATYTEISPSGRGLKLFLRGRLPGTRRRKGKVEMYDHGRYFTVTGLRLPGTPATLEDCQGELDVLYGEIFGTKTRLPLTSAAKGTVPTATDEALVAKARSAKNGERFSALFDRGDTSGHGGDHSAADLALCSHLAFWTGGDEARIDRLFRRSALMRPKWDARRCGSTYGEITIQVALRGATEVYKSLEASKAQGSHNGTDPATTGAPAREALSRQAIEELADLGSDPDPDVVIAKLQRIATALTGCDALTVESARELVVRALRHKVQAPARMFDAALKETGGEATDTLQGRALSLDDPEPWPEAVDGAALLTELEATFRRFLVLVEGAAPALALWTLHTYAHEAASISPILGLTSPEKRCGKTTLISLLLAVVRRPLPASNITAAALFRAVEKYGPTLLIDEADTFLREREELQGILNSGHTRETAYVVRTVGDEHEARCFSTWSPKAIALIGRLPPTLEDRSIPIAMVRKAPGETVERLRLDRLGQLADLRRRALRWTLDREPKLRQADPDVPEGLHDRAADNWRPLLAIADDAGGDWPAKAREAARLLSASEGGDSSSRVQLLADVRAAFEASGTDRLSTEALLAALVADESKPWGEWHRGKPLTAHRLARLLKPLGVSPRKVRIGEETRQGYRAEDLADAVVRYLPAATVPRSDPEHPEQVNNGAPFRGSPIRNTKGRVPDREAARTPTATGVVPDVPDRNAGARGEGGPEREVFEL